MSDTIVALSTGQGRAALAIVRLSGPAVRFVIEMIVPTGLEPNVAKLIALRDPDGARLIDRCVAIFFEGPRSSTGEDVLELHLHGSAAVVEACLTLLVRLRHDVRLAQPGEFTRRALENGKLDLLQVEALGALLEAQTQRQLDQAMRQMSGELGSLCLQWRDRLIDMRALIEAELDFSDEGDVEVGLTTEVRTRALRLQDEVREVLGSARRGARVQDGTVIALAGPPNAGKSQLMNALSGRDMSIVTDRPGTTRDIIECPMVIDGWPVILSDTAGLRDSEDMIEQEGVRRAQSRIKSADMILLVIAADAPGHDAALLGGDPRVIRVANKSDILPLPAEEADVHVSALTSEGLQRLRAVIGDRLHSELAGEPALVARERQRQAIMELDAALTRVIAGHQDELIAEDLRSASSSLARLAGQTDIENVLDRLFAGFCIGK